MHAEISKGFVVLLGVEQGDGNEDANYIIKKIAGLRIFTDINDKMNLSILDVSGEMLVISQFTLLGDARHGNRPSFSNAELPAQANALFEYCCAEWQRNGLKIKKGVFGADMKVALVNDGPVTIILDSKKII